MGRMLDTMKLGDFRRLPLAVNKPADSHTAQDCVVDWEIGAEVPFVEVGGPNKKVELSPGLMVHPAQPSPPPPHLAVAPTSLVPTPLTTAPAAINFTEPKPMTAAFEPWPVAGPGPTVVSREIVAYHHPEHPTSKEYASLLATMRRASKNDRSSVLLMLGIKPHVGTTTVLLNLAVTAALQGVRVIAVDANPQHACLAQRLGQGQADGVVQVLNGSLALEDAIIKTGIGTLHTLPAGGPAKHPISQEAMGWLMTWLRDRYELILVDGPSLADSSAQVAHTDGIYLVLPRGESLPAAVAQTLGRMGGKLCGLIHTHFEA